MATKLQLCDARGADVEGSAELKIRITDHDGKQTTLTDALTGPASFRMPVESSWVSADVSISHPDYAPHELNLRWDRTVLWWGDPAAESQISGDDQTLRVPLSRIRFAPGQFPPFQSTPSGDERGVYLQKSDRMQRYGGIGFELLAVPKIRTLTDYQLGKPALPTCILNPHIDDGWQRFSVADAINVEPGKGGGFVWLEYGSPDSRPQQPRFLIAVYVPLPDQALKDNAVDMLVFYSPTTVNDLYQPSTYPFRDKYPYAAYAREMVDKGTGQKLGANVQPYVLLGYKYLFHPTHLVGMSLRSRIPPIVVMPIFPRASGQNGVRQMWQPFNSQAGLWRLLIEIAQFLEREGYTGSFFSVRRLNGAVAPTSGNVAPPPPAFTRGNRVRLGIRDIIVSGYSSGSAPMNTLLVTPAIVSALDFPPNLFGADAKEFDKRWKEFWGLDLFLNEKQTGIRRNQFEQQLRSWLTRDARRLRLYQSGWTLEGTMPDEFFSALRQQLNRPPRMLTDATLPTRWSADWRDPRNQWSAIFFSSPVLRASYVDPGIVPSFPLGTSDGSKGDPPGVVHPFALQIGFGHATSLR